MNMNKENDNIRTKSKIPIPLNPLPALPASLLKKNEDTERLPLKILNLQPINFSNSAIINEKRETIDKTTKCPLKIDSRHVTTRQTSEDLDWDYNVFKDESEKSVITISDEELTSQDLKDDERKYFIDNHIKNCLGQAIKAVTPVFKSPSLEPNRVKNIKRSLKRPHSRELQGLSPTNKEYKGEERHKRRLDFIDCKEKNVKSLGLNTLYKTSLTVAYDMDIYEHLLSIEGSTLMPKLSSNARACVINWLMRVNGPEGNPTVVQTAKWYLDSILAIAHIHVGHLQVVAAACYWIAKKTYGPAISARKLVKCSDQAFTAGRLGSTEVAILSKLNFPTLPVVPQDFIEKFSWHCDSSRPEEIEVAATFLCMSSLMVDKCLCPELPSVIAAASVHNALLLLGKSNLMEKLYKNPIFAVAAKKTSNLSFICYHQRKAVRIVASSRYEYKAPLEFYGVSPFYVAQRIVSAATEYNSNKNNL